MVSRLVDETLWKTAIKLAWKGYISKYFQNTWFVSVSEYIVLIQSTEKHKYMAKIIINISQEVGSIPLLCPWFNLWRYANFALNYIHIVPHLEILFYTTQILSLSYFHSVTEWLNIRPTTVLLRNLTTQVNYDYFSFSYILTQQYGRFMKNYFIWFLA